MPSYNNVSGLKKMFSSSCGPGYHRSKGKTRKCLKNGKRYRCPTGTRKNKKGNCVPGGKMMSPMDPSQMFKSSFHSITPFVRHADVKVKRS